jgi:soluble lytic murein transglycosylase
LDQQADSWYRLAAAYRLGLAMVDPLEPDPATVAASTATKDAETTTPSAPPSVSPDEYALQLGRFGLGARLRTELGTGFNTLSWDTIRMVASTLSDSGRHAQAYRLIATLFWKAEYKPIRADAELYWPRPYRDAFTRAADDADVDEFLLYGLARSESAFDPAAVSKSGAVGLTQLMPATAEEMAGRLKLREWSLTKPEDNLTIGSAYFARVLNGVDGRVLPAVFSYNGGPNRFKRWEAEYGALPLDLLLEALSYAETRQYGRNVASAALSYAALYGEFDLRGYFSWLIGETPHP